jgi:hypothetical protein
MVARGIGGANLKAVAMEDWNTTVKMYGISCFVHADPPDKSAEGNAAQFFASEKEADAWARKALRAGRFKFLALYRNLGDGWDHVKDY